MEDHVPDHSKLDFGYDLHPHESGVIEVEVWPKAGSWNPFVVVVPVAERARLNTVSLAPRTQRHIELTSVQRVDVDAGAYAGIGLHNRIGPDVSARIFFASRPSEVQFGQVGQPLHVLRF